MRPSPLLGNNSLLDQHAGSLSESGRFFAFRLRRLRRRRLSIANTLGTLLEEQNLDRSKYKPEVRQEGQAVDIKQVHFQLVVRIRVVAAVYLRHAGKTRAHLQTQRKLRQILFILRRNLRSLGANSSILAWRIPWTEDLGGLQSIES